MTDKQSPSANGSIKERLFAGADLIGKAIFRTKARSGALIVNRCSVSFLSAGLGGNEKRYQQETPGVTMRMLCLPPIAVLMAVICLGPTFNSTLHAQSMNTTASLSVTVSDPSGARIPQATVKLTNPEHGVTRVITTGSAGESSFALLLAGTYTLEASAPGFETSRQTGIVLNVGDSLTEEIRLTIGGSDQFITVNGSGPSLQAQDANISSDVGSKQLEELPLNLRNVVGFATLNSSVNNQVQQQSLTAGGQEDTADQDISFLTFGGGFF